MKAEASILHADLDAFYASVEQRDDPALQKRPVIVGAGVVLAASYEAKAAGVRTAMNVNQALRRCPSAVVVMPRMPAYLEASTAVFAVFHRTTPLVEALSIDEAFLDVGGLKRLSGAAVDIAARLRAEVRKSVGLPISVGVARTKFLAKVASAVAKPDGLLVVDPGREREFLHPLAVERLWGVGGVTAAKLHQRGLHTVGDVAEVGETSLISMLGPSAGARLHALAHNRDPRSVEVAPPRRSVGSQRAFRATPRSAREIDADIVALVDQVARRLRASGRVGRTIVLRLRFADFSRATRSHTLPRATAHTATILLTVRALVDGALPVICARGLTLLGVAVANLDEGDHQLDLPMRGGGALDAALDSVRARFGPSAVTRAVLMDRPGDGLGGER